MHSLHRSALVFALVAVAAPLAAQDQRSNSPPVYPPNPGHSPSYQLTPGGQKSSNVKLVGHVGLGGYLHVSDIDVEQELSRPYAYVTKRFHPTGVDIIDIKDPSKPKVIWQWRIENSELHQGSGALNPMYFKHKRRYYVTVATQFSQGGPDVDLGAIIFDVTSLPDVSKIREVGRILNADETGGFHESFTYKHSSGTPLLITTATAPHANVYDMDKFVSGNQAGALVGRIPTPPGSSANNQRGYHDFYLGYDVAKKQDRFYGAGAGGFHTYDITDVTNPAHQFSATGISGIANGHTITPTPDGAFAVVETEYQYAPLRMLDLRDGQSGKVKNI